MTLNLIWHQGCVAEPKQIGAHNPHLPEDGC
jgi:hypothetical protein